ncbi:hypothetical protein BDQ17DRAFT_1539979 [Cyathus striatus]|nr:hypothetical protein BDQ17DRAFT_1539979 [Cyathus striatus]
MSHSNCGSKSNPSKSKPSSSRWRKRSPSINMVKLNEFGDPIIGTLSPLFITRLAPDKDKGFDWLESEISEIINRLRELDMKMQEILLEIQSIT